MELLEQTIAKISPELNEQAFAAATERLANQAKPAGSLGIMETVSARLAAIKGAFNARHGGVGGLSRVTHDLLLRQYLDTAESKELNRSFNERSKPDPSKFGQ